ncbi:hypothetical protein D3Z53_18660 [Lachnospiraceae bacterium]|nr:hypothetical protein [Lachnospiraceae bacterium]
MVSSGRIVVLPPPSICVQAKKENVHFKRPFSYYCRKTAKCRSDICPSTNKKARSSYAGHSNPSDLIYKPNPDKPEKFFCISSKFQVQ